ncbi:hypothetical protein GE09DRAFT_210245 [Coniochaeta sp. 2T2.1]|nr:hypothetical protein GE09DRAFT_210245 [Coniochaeta sp. 2T2.1]
MPFPTQSPNVSMTKEAMVADDDHTLCSDAGSIYSESNASTSSFVSYTAYDELPPFRLPKADSNKEVYEAWTIYLSRDYDEPISSSKFCGITSVKRFDNFMGSVSSISELYDQKELTEMYLKSLDKYKSTHKRSWPSRLVRGTATSYEDDIDARTRKLPNAVQSEIAHILGDREDASSNRFHNRAWTVVMMQEQLHRRFADAKPKVVDKRHKVRFWKNPGKNDPVEYFIIIRGREGRQIRDRQGQAEFKRFENPWHHADEAEMRKRTREEINRRREKRGKTFPPPSYRYTPPPPPPPPVFPYRGMDKAPGPYTRPHMGTPYYPTTSSLPGRPAGWPRPRAAPMPPMNFAPPVPHPSTYGPQPPPPPLSRPNAFAPNAGPYGRTYCGGTGTGKDKPFFPFGLPRPGTGPVARPACRPAYGGFRPANPMSGKFWVGPQGKVTHEPSTNKAPGRTVSVSSISEQSHKPPRSGRPAYAKSMDLCYSHETSENSSIQSWWSDDNDKNSDAGEGRLSEKSNRMPLPLNEPLEDYQRQLMELESHNKRRLMAARQEQEEKEGAAAWDKQASPEENEAESCDQVLKDGATVEGSDSSAEDVDANESERDRARLLADLTAPMICCSRSIPNPDDDEEDW